MKDEDGNLMFAITAYYYDENGTSVLEKSEYADLTTAGTWATDANGDYYNTSALTANGHLLHGLQRSQLDLHRDDQRRGHGVQHPHFV